MKQKPDETLDQWVRQSINQLPDTPPPGSSFDSERLWTQLRPQLQAQPVRRRNRWVWLAAACLTALVLSWFVWQKLSARQPLVATYHHLPKTSDVQPKKVEPLDKRTTSEPALAEKPQRKFKSNTFDNQKFNTKNLINAASVSHPLAQDVAAQVPDSAALTIGTPVVEKPTERNKPNVAITKPKRRFRVMHENELRAEEEAAPKLYRTDHFVRIGTERSDEPITEPRQTAPPLSLTTKKSQ